MTTSYSTLITTHGLSLLAMAQAGGATISLTQMALGDGNGTVPTPSAAQTALVHEVYRAALNSLAPDSNNPPYIVAEMVIPTTVGGFTVTEVGLFDSAGNLFCVGNFPSTYKPVLAEGSARDLVIRVIMEVGNAASVQLLIDPAVVLASRGWVQSLFAPLSGAAFTGNVSTTANVTASALLTANIAIVGGQIYETATNGNAALAVNYTGYQAGTTQYRDFSINDGKQNLIASFIGATHSINLHGGVTVNANTGV
ncbi:MAG: phage tail protein, partial [Azospirillaceae bacterium]|nr:phage tail protein [Azospirillaceae bacterium]